jgi:hypothetical protein
MQNMKAVGCYAWQLSFFWISPTHCSFLMFTGFLAYHHYNQF